MIEIITLIFAGLAAVAAIAAAVVSALLQSRSQKSAWLRSEQVLAYEGFSAAGWAGLDEIAGGAVHRALDHPTFEGLEESYAAVTSHDAAITQGLRRILIVGGERARPAAANHAQLWTKLARGAVLLSGATHVAANAQRMQHIGSLTASLLLVSRAMSTDLGLFSGNSRKRAASVFASESARLFESAFARQPSDSVGTLLEWRVRDWNWNYATSATSYATSDYPWAMMNLPQLPPELRQPLAAVLRKQPDHAWRLAYDALLLPEDLAIVLDECAGIVSGNGMDDSVRFGGDTWAAGEVIGERIYSWSIARLPSTRNRPDAASTGSDESD